MTKISIFLFALISLLFLSTFPSITTAQTTLLNSWYHRSAFFDLDTLWDTDITRIELNVDSALRYIQSLGANTVIIKAFSEKSAQNQIDTVYFTNPLLPDRGDGVTTPKNLFKYCADKFIAQGYKVGAFVPILRWGIHNSEIASDNNLEYVSIWDPVLHVSAPPSSTCVGTPYGCRLSPFSSENGDFVKTLYESILTQVPNLHIIHGGLDGILTNYEDCSRSALDAYIEAELITESTDDTLSTLCAKTMALTSSPTNRNTLTEIKTNAISNFFGNIINSLRNEGTIKYPNLISTRSLSYPSLESITKRHTISQSIPSSLPMADFMSIQLFPITDNVEYDTGINPNTKAFNWYFKQSIDYIKTYDPNLTRTQIVLQTTYTTTTVSSGQSTSTQITVDPLLLREWVRLLIEDLGVYHIAFSPTRPLSLIPAVSTPLRQLVEKANNRCIGTDTPDSVWQCPPSTEILCTFSPTHSTCRDASTVCINTPSDTTNCPIVKNCITSITTYGCSNYRCTVNPEASGCHQLYISMIENEPFSTTKEYIHFHPGNRVILTWNTQAQVYPKDTTISVVMTYVPYDTASKGPIQQFNIIDSLPNIDLSTGTYTIKIPDGILLGRNIAFSIIYTDSSSGSIKNLELETDPTRGKTYTVPFCADPTSIIPNQSSNNPNSIPFTIQYQNKCTGGSSCDVFNTGLCRCDHVIHPNYTPDDPYDLCNRHICTDFVQCHNNGLCLDKSSPFKCHCDDKKWGGDKCQVELYCQERVRYGWCLNNGHSRQFPNTSGSPEDNTSCNPTCLCENKWSGQRCNECTLQCKNGGNQTNTCDQCKCRSGYYGQLCQCREVKWEILMTTLPPKIDRFYSTLLRSFYTSNSDGSISLVPTVPQFHITDDGIRDYIHKSLLDVLQGITPSTTPTTTSPFTRTNFKINSVIAIVTTSPFSLKITGTLNDNCSSDIEGNNYDEIIKVWDEKIIQNDSEHLDGKITIENQSIEYTVTTTPPDMKCDRIYTLIPDDNDNDDEDTPECEEQDRDENGDCIPIPPAPTPTPGKLIIQHANIITKQRKKIKSHNSIHTLADDDDIPPECVLVPIVTQLDGLDFEGEPNNTYSIQSLFILSLLFASLML